MSFPTLRWHGSVAGLLADAAPSLQRSHALEAWIESRPSFTGWCTVCEAPSEFTVNGGAMLGVHVNLREGMVCPGCGINARGRLMLLSLEETFPDHAARIALFEAFSPLSRLTRRRWPNLLQSEYFGDGLVAGSEHALRLADGTQRIARHQDLMALGYGDGELDGLVHNDVLEHVPEVGVALAEMFRVLRPGGRLLFTMPWFPWRPQTLVRGRRRADGSLQELEPPEFHGDGLREGGIYTYYNFGADIGEPIRQAGFVELEFGVCYSPTCGFLGNNYRYGPDGLMLPTVLRARRP